ncbi:DNA replication initiation control protein YabA [Halomonas sp. C22]|uniref:DNA replication initiation control protein YabA n=1 Tax=Halomonas sp. C22 TaxID=2580567 RepID=UPI0011A26760|nr:DNA replication initiation control protein YabA [Halomonas sp. C22]
MTTIATHLGTGALLSRACRRAAVTQLIYRNDDLEAEKYGLIEENNALAAENAKLRLELAEQAKQLATMRAA